MTESNQWASQEIREVHDYIKVIQLIMESQFRRKKKFMKRFYQEATVSISLKLPLASMPFIGAVQILLSFEVWTPINQ